MENQYFIRRGKNVIGPISSEKLKKGISRVKIKLTDEISDRQNAGYVILKQVWRDAIEGKWRSDEQPAAQAYDDDLGFDDEIWTDDIEAEINSFKTDAPPAPKSNWLTKPLGSKKSKKRKSKKRKGSSHNLDYGTSYRGVFIRFLAYVIDMSIINISLTAILMLLWSYGLFSLSARPGESQQNGKLVEFFSIQALHIITIYCYFTILTSSVWQATLGKKMLGMIVVDSDGNRLSPFHAFRRIFILSFTCLVLGPLWALFNSRKQGLHDVLVGTYVISPR